MDKWLATLKDWLDVLGILAVWIAGLWGWSVRQANRRDKRLRADIKDDIDGVGRKVNALEITVGSHEAALDRQETALGSVVRDQQQSDRELGEFKSDLNSLRNSLEAREEATNKILTDIQVNIGSISSKVDIVLRKMDL